MHTFCTKGQDLVIPLKDGKIFYENIDTVQEKSKEQLYLIIKPWVAKAFVDAKEVIQVDDKAAGQLIGKGIFYIHSTGLASAIWPCYFTFEFTIKENKYRVQITDLRYGEAKYAAEYLYDQYKAGKMKKSMSAMLTDIDNHAKSIFKSIKASVRKNAEEF